MRLHSYGSNPVNRRLGKFVCWYKCFYCFSTEIIIARNSNHPCKDLSHHSTILQSLSVQMLLPLKSKLYFKYLCMFVQASTRSFNNVTTSQPTFQFKSLLKSRLCTYSRPEACSTSSALTQYRNVESLPVKNIASMIGIATEVIHCG